jgi:prepilin-type N-terminal cleavage/methylation domain-containing protein
MTRRPPDARPSAGQLGSEQGFTLIELIISMVIIGVIFAVFSITMGATIRTSSEVQEDSVLQGEVRATVDVIAKDLRQAYTGNGNPGLETMLPAELQFVSPDRATPFHLRRIKFRLSGTEIQRASARSTNTGSPPWTFPALSPYTTQVGSVVNTTIFRYYNSAGVVATQPADVASVTITLTVANPASPSRRFTYATSVAIRVAH